MAVWIMCSLIGIQIVSTLSQVVKNESSLSLASPRPRSHVTPGARLEYRLVVRLQDGHGGTELEIRVNATNLVPLGDAYFGKSNLTWMDMESDRLEHDLTGDVVVSVIAADMASPAPTIKLILPTMSGSKLLSNIHTTLGFYVSDETTFGFLLRPMMYVTFRGSSAGNSHALIVGEYVFMEIPGMQLSEALPADIDMKQRSKVQSSLSLPSGVMGTSVLTLYMPNNLTMEVDVEDLYIEEPYMTMTSFRYLGSSGLSKSSVTSLGQISPLFLSNSRSSEQDGVTIVVPELSTDTAPAHIDFESEAEMLDFAGAVPGTEMMMVHVLQTGSDFFIIRHSSAFVRFHNEVKRSPDLMISFDILETYVEPQLLTLHVLVSLDHRKLSWGSAYNVTLVVYLPYFLAVSRLGPTSDVLKNSPTIMTVDGSNLEFELKRVSFVQSPRFHVNVTVDTDASQYVPGECYTVEARAVYQGWRGAAELATHDDFLVTIGEKIVEPEPRCAEEGEVCETCRPFWLCEHTIHGHGLKSTLVDSHGVRYICSPANITQKSWEIVPCIRIDTNNDITGMAPGLGTLLGVSETAVYGIARNGMAYVLSYDGGQEWYSIEGAVYTEAASQGDFIAAQLTEEPALNDN